MSNDGWIGVDLDGTLAEYNGWVHETHIGPPVPLMLERVKRWVREGRRVKIMTARAYGNRPDAITAIQKWCIQHIGIILEITCVKDYGMIELWDDRAVQIMPNTGRRVDGGV